jgi:hypothetical protein
MKDALFNLDEVKQLSPRMQLIQDHDLQWHYSDCRDYPYLIIPMKIARHLLKGYITKDEPLKTVEDMTASYGRLLDEAEMTFYGSKKDELVTEAIARSIQYQKEMGVAL